MMAKDVSAHIADGPPIRLPEARLCFRERRLVQPKPLPPHPLNLVRLCGFRDGRVSVTDPRVNVMGTNLFDPLHEIVRLLRFVLDHQHVDRHPGDLDFPERKRRESGLKKLVGVATEKARDLGLCPAPLADIDRTRREVVIADPKHKESWSIVLGVREAQDIVNQIPLLAYCRGLKSQ